jgi:ribosome maturation factor RimP
MQWTTREPDPIYDAIEPVVAGLGFTLVEMTVSRHKGSVQVQITVFNPGSAAPMGTADCARVHKAVVPRLDLALEDADYSVTVSTPGIERRLKDGSEFRHYVGRAVRCWLTGADDWERGILTSADDKRIVLKEKEGMKEIEYAKIAKAKLDSAGSGPKEEA